MLGWKPVARSGAIPMRAHELADIPMNQIKALLGSTWWMWPPLFMTLFALTVWVESALIITFPLCIGIFLYFAFVRFDEDGNRRES